MARSKISSIKRTRAHFERQEPIPAFISERYAIKLRRRIKNQAAEIKSRMVQNAQLSADNLVYRRKAHEHEFEILRRDKKLKELDESNDQLRAKSASWMELYQKERVKTGSCQVELSLEKVKSEEFRKKLNEEIAVNSYETDRGDGYKSKLKECEKLLSESTKSKNSLKSQTNRLGKSLGSLVTKINEAEQRSKEVQKKTTELFRSVSVDSFNKNTESALLIKKLIDMAERQNIIDDVSCTELFKYFKITSKKPDSEEVEVRVRIREPVTHVVDEDADEDELNQPGLVTPPQNSQGPEWVTQEMGNTQGSEWATQEMGTQELELNDSEEEMSYSIDHCAWSP